MLLAIDIGNTNITIGIFYNDKLIKTFRINTKEENIGEIYKDFLVSISEYNIDSCIISSVVKNIDFIISKITDDELNIKSIVFDKNLKTNLKIKTDNPSEVGSDRILNVISAKEKYGYPLIIVDVGTATTFDIIDTNGDFSGGIILPGINMQFLALNKNTSLLPKISPEKIDYVIGKNTKDNILIGVIRGHACAVDGLIEECEKELGSKVKVIGTGGMISYISDYMNHKFDYIDNKLTLDGLNLLYKINKGN